jgi:hypothetical protein
MLNFYVNLTDAGGLLLLVYIVVAIIIAGFTARIASDKGHDGVGWFFLGLVTGFVGLAIALAMPQATSSYEDTRDSKFWSRKTEEMLKKMEEENGDDDRVSFDG